MEIDVTSCPFFDDYNNAKTEYDKLLYDKSKSDPARSHDVKQILYLLNNDRYVNEVLITWDMSLPKLRDKLLSINNQYKSFPIYNPAKLSNKIALECFNIDSSAITNDIFIYADKNFGLSNKVKSLLEMMAPIYGNKKTKNSKILKALGNIRKNQLDSMENNEKDLHESTLPIDGVFIKILDIISEKEQEKKEKNIMKKFVAFMLEAKNEAYILNVVNQWSNAISAKNSFDYSEFFNEVSKIEIRQM